MQKILVVLGVVFLQVAFGDFTENDLRSSTQECLKELNLAADVMLKSVNEDWTVIEGNADINSISLCAFRKENLLNDDDTLNFDKYKDFLITVYFAKAKLNFDNPAEAASNGIDACKSLQGSDAGDTLVKYYNCIVKYYKAAA